MTAPVKVRNVVLGEGRPKICVPIVAKDDKELIEAANELLHLPADLVEWRADWYEKVSGLQEAEEAVSEGLTVLRQILGDRMPIIFTVRTRGEGGAASFPQEAYLSLIQTAIAGGQADLVDVEFFAGQQVTDTLIGRAHSQGIKVILSSHDFTKTPPLEEMTARLAAMEERGGDILKLAVTPWSPEDVLALLQATVKMRNNLSGRPLITMSMGGTGIISRLAGETFGSCMTFGCSQTASAPGQMDARELSQILEIVHRTMTER